MKVVFLFMCSGNASPNSTSRKYPDWKCGQRYFESSTEGYFKMFQALVDNGTIDDLKIFWESNIEPGVANWVKGENVYCEVIPEIRFVEEYIKKDTIIFVRGGFRHWHNFLLKYKFKNWLLLYAANTGRERWEWWDIVFNDIGTPKNYIDSRGRFFFYFVKPINEDLFYLHPFNWGDKWDFCIGASHIHDRKGQWRTIEALQEYEKLYGISVKAIMPGAPRRGTKTIEMIKNLTDMKNIEIPGQVSRAEIRKIMNGSKYFIHLGAHGQNDRGPLEAIACGTPIILGSPQYHAKYLSDNFFTFSGINTLSSNVIAAKLKNLLDVWSKDSRIKTLEIYKKENGFHEVVIPRMTKLFNLLSKYPPRTSSKFTILNKFEKGEE